MSVRLIHRTDDTEKLIAYMARVSSPHQDNPNIEKLLKYLIDHKHWSPFEMCNMCIEIVTDRAISAQILRHKSLSFQEWSQRYSKTIEYEFHEPRLQDTKNRQNSIETDNDEIHAWFLDAQEQVQQLTSKLYNEALDKGIAKETSRYLLPMATQTKLYVNGNLRSWITYINVRTDMSTQKEHREIAEGCKKIFINEFPTIAKALNWC